MDRFTGAGETYGWNFQENKKGRVVLRKTSSKDHSKLAGAVFDLYEEGKDTPLKTGLTTDVNGEIHVSDLKPGYYYFKETKAPIGYEKTDEVSSVQQVKVMNEKHKEEEHLGAVKLIKTDNKDTKKILKRCRIFIIWSR